METNFRDYVIQLKISELKSMLKNNETHLLNDLYALYFDSDFVFPNTIICNKCGKEKDENEFWVLKGNTTHTCEDCHYRGTALKGIRTILYNEYPFTLEKRINKLKSEQENFCQNKCLKDKAEYPEECASFLNSTCPFNYRCEYLYSYEREYDRMDDKRKFEGEMDKLITEEHIQLKTYLLKIQRKLDEYKRNKLN